MLLFEPPPHLSLSLSGRDAARRGRRAVEELVGAVPTSRWLAQDAALAVSELVTNAIRAAGHCTLSAWYHTDELAVRGEVTDTSHEMPAIQPLDSERVGGHGLRIVADVSTRWGVIEREDSKVVWFEITSPPGN